MNEELFMNGLNLLMNEIVDYQLKRSKNGAKLHPMSTKRMASIIMNQRHDFSTVELH